MWKVEELSYCNSCSCRAQALVQVHVSNDKLCTVHRLISFQQQASMLMLTAGGYCAEGSLHHTDRAWQHLTCFLK